MKVLGWALLISIFCLSCSKGITDTKSKGPGRDEKNPNEKLRELNEQELQFSSSTNPLSNNVILANNIKEIDVIIKGFNFFLNQAATFKLSNLQMNVSRCDRKIVPNFEFYLSQGNSSERLIAPNSWVSLLPNPNNRVRGVITNSAICESIQIRFAASFKTGTRLVDQSDTLCESWRVEHIKVEQSGFLSPLWSGSLKDCPKFF